MGILNLQNHITADIVDKFDQLPSITNVNKLARITEQRTLELGYWKQSQDSYLIEENRNDSLILLNNLERTLDYSSRNEQNFFDKNIVPFKATGTRSMLMFKDPEYTAQLADSRFITAVNFKPFHPQAGIIIPKPTYEDGAFLEQSMSWFNVDVDDLSYLKRLSQGGISIWNAMSAPSSPYMHFQFIPNQLDTMAGGTRLPLNEAVMRGDYRSNQVLIGTTKINCFVETDPFRAIDALCSYESSGIYSDLIITDGKFILVPKRADRYIVKYPWNIYWKPTAERLGFIFYHPNMQPFIDNSELSKNFWRTNNSQVLAES